MSEGVSEAPAAPAEVQPFSAPPLRAGWRPPSERLIARLARLQSPQWAAPFTLQPSADLRPAMPPVYDQLDSFACCGNAVGGLVQYLWMQAGLSPNEASRLFLYWNARAIDGSTAVDHGTSVAATVLGAYQRGCCREQYWSYVQPHILQPPSAAAAADAGQHRFAAPIRVQGLDSIRGHIAGGHPVAFGINIHASFYLADSRNGVVPMPDPDAPATPHAALLVGYDDEKGHLVMRNSWGLHRANGQPCGDAGHYYLPYGYLDPRLTSDFWTLSAA